MAFDAVVFTLALCVIRESANPFYNCVSSSVFRFLKLVVFCDSGLFMLLLIAVPSFSACTRRSSRAFSPVRGDNLRALARGLSPVQADKPWYYYFILFSNQCRPC